MIRRDLETARNAWIAEATTAEEKKKREGSDFLTYRTRDGKVADFHALRHTFITNLVNAGVQPKDTKELSRHSTITLTMDRYSHVGIRDTAAALERLKLPTLSAEVTGVSQVAEKGGECLPYVLPDVPATGDEGGKARTDEEIYSVVRRRVTHRKPRN
jgi:hypothetical protein